MKIELYARVPSGFYLVAITRSAQIDNLPQYLILEILDESRTGGRPTARNMQFEFGNIKGDIAYYFNFDPS